MMHGHSYIAGYECKYSVTYMSIMRPRSSPRSNNESSTTLYVNTMVSSTSYCPVI